MRERRTHPGSPMDCPKPSGHKSRAQSALGHPFATVLERESPSATSS